MQSSHFSLLKCLEGIAKAALCDTSSHSILSGEQYAEVGYLQKQDEKKHIVRYQHPKKQESIFIHIVSIFVTEVVLNKDLCIIIYEYQSIFHGGLWFIYIFIY